MTSESKDPPPVSNDYVAPGCEQFTDHERANYLRARMLAAADKAISSSSGEPKVSVLDLECKECGAYTIACTRCGSFDIAMRSSAPGLEWHEAPKKTEWGVGMMCATVALSRDETLWLYAHKSALHLVPPALSPAAPEAQPKRSVGWPDQLKVLQNAFEDQGIESPPPEGEPK